jgi:hypothetical protein
MVEAAGVEPASEKVTGQETTCLFAFMPRAFAALRRFPQDVRGDLIYLPRRFRTCAVPVPDLWEDRGAGGWPSLSRFVRRLGKSIFLSNPSERNQMASAENVTRDHMFIPVFN